MPKGPHELRLDSYVTGGNVDTIRHSARVWTQGQRVLERLATALETAKPQLMHKFGPQTGPAAAAAFEKVAGNVRDQAKEMQRASAALTTAADALHDAQTTHHQLGNAPASPPPDASQKSGESAEAFHLRQRDVTAAQNHYATESAQREQQSQRATHGVDTKYDHAIKVMESIHGRPARSGHGTSGTGGAGVPGGSVPPPSSTGAGGPRDSSWITPTGGQHTGPHTGQPTGGHHPGQVTDGGTGNGNVDSPPTYDDPGVPQGPGYADPGYADPGTSTVPGGVPTSPGGQVPLGPSATSTVAGGVISTGIVGGTTGLTNAMRTTAMTAMTAEEQAALSASRTTASTGATTGAAVAGRGGAVGMAGSSRAGGRGTGRAAGAGAGGRGDRGKKRKRPAGTDFFDEGDWLDDDETSPGVLD
jgi:hypothetical protein